MGNYLTIKNTLCHLEIQLICHAPWTATSSSPLRPTTSSFSVLPSLRNPTPPSFQRPSVNLSTTLGMVFSEPVDGLVTSWLPPTTSVLSSDTLTTSAKVQDTSMLPLVSSTPSSSSPAERTNDALLEPSKTTS